MTRAMRLAVAIAAAPGPAADEGGTDTVTYDAVSWERSDPAKVGTLRRGRSKTVILADDPGSRVQLAPQEGAVTTVFAADGVVVSDSEFRDMSDADGDTWLIWFSNAAAGRVREIIGGTGKYADMTGSGTTELLLLTPDGRMVIRRSGAWRL